MVYFAKVFQTKVGDEKEAPKPKKQKEKIKPLSAKRKKQNDEYLKLRKVFLSENRLCAVKLDGCKKYSSEIHHSEKRTGSLLTEVEFFVAICRNCHTKVENDNIKFDHRTK